jgi:YVTN family beta-propeller protein
VARPTYRALLIANSTFPSDPQNLRELEGPRNDPALLRDALSDRECGLFPADNIRLVLERTMAEVLLEVEDFFRTATRQDSLLLYYSGHGLLDQSSEFFLCTRDTRSDRLRATALKASDIRSMIDESAAATTMIVLDCCHSGAFKGGDVPNALAGNGRFVITSCRGGELANDSHARNHASVFTHHLVQGLLSGASDHDGDGVVNLSELYEYVHRELTSEGRQIPQKRFEGSGDVPIALRAVEAAATASESIVVQPTAAPELDVSPASIELGEVDHDQVLPDERVAVVNRGGGELHWTVDTTASWIEPLKVGNGIRLGLRPPPPGSHRANVFVTDTATGAIATVRVSVDVRAAPAAPATPGEPAEPAGGQKAATGEQAPPLPEPPGGQDGPPGGGGGGGGDDGRRRRWLAVGGGALAVVLLGVGGWALLGGDDGSDPASPTSAAGSATSAGASATTAGASATTAGASAGSPATTAGSPATAAAPLVPPTVTVAEPIPVEDFPDGLALHGGELWVAATFANALDRIDPASGRVAGRLPTGAEPIALASGADGLWVTVRGQQAVVRIDTATGAQTPVELGVPAGNLTLAPSAVWVTSGPANQLLKVDPATMAVVERIEMPVPSGVLAAGGSLWVTAYEANEVWRLDPDTGERLGTIPTEANPDPLAAGDGVVWVGNRGAGTISRIDVAEERVTATVDVGTAPTGIAVDGDRVWVVDSSEGTLVLVDGPRATKVGQWPVGSRPLNVIVDGDQLWVALSNQDAVARVTVG